jgi:hypothetical protein
MCFEQHPERVEIEGCKRPFRVEIGSGVANEKLTVHKPDVSFDRRHAVTKGIE